MPAHDSVGDALRYDVDPPQEQTLPNLSRTRRAVRTELLLGHVCATIQAATNKSEAFSGLARWMFFGGEGTIPADLEAQDHQI